MNEIGLMYEILNGNCSMELGMDLRIVVKLDIVMKLSYWFMDLDHGFWMFEIWELDNWLLNGS